MERLHDRSRERQHSRDRSPIERGSRRDSTRLTDRNKDRTNKEKEKERSYRDEEAYEQRRVDKRQRERDAAYKEVLLLHTYFVGLTDSSQHTYYQ